MNALAEPACDRGRPRAASLVLLRDRAVARADPSAFVGVATCWNEAAPCNISLMRQAQAVKQGVAAAANTPRGATITVTGASPWASGHEIVANVAAGHRR
jgi:dihydroxyacid dehydratase/phosphogluconate dehydratase